LIGGKNKRVPSGPRSSVQTGKRGAETVRGGQTNLSSNNIRTVNFSRDCSRIGRGEGAETQRKSGHKTAQFEKRLGYASSKVSSEWGRKRTGKRESNRKIERRCDGSRDANSLKKKEGTTNFAFVEVRFWLRRKDETLAAGGVEWKRESTGSPSAEKGVK